jgi:hypothetical protein
MCVRYRSTRVIWQLLAVLAPSLVTSASAAAPRHTTTICVFVTGRDCP